MEKKKKRYWVVTGFMSMFMLFTAFYSLSMKDAFLELGFPEYFWIELNAAKIIGAVCC